jgi:hypothetical protein
LRVVGGFLIAKCRRSLGAVASSGGGRCHGDEDGGATGGWVSGGARGVAQRKLETKVGGKGQRRRRGGRGGT